ncbi:serine/threonine protein phosphatase [Nocardia sp. NPDC004568]|uniref:serine/threonine protein phosphatase n=1 Tax=Nocardia sp. NPDC004568 TaxID=3154551 RepID=UPI0033AC2420
MSTPRSARRRRLSALLASHSDTELVALMGTGRPETVGVGGGSLVLDVSGVPVFAKRIPVTDRELAHRGSTANLFDLPVFCQYGIGGPSVNAWRELAANIAVTDGEAATFPMLYHWRVLPGRSPIAAEHADIDEVVAAYGGCPAVRARLEALAGAASSLVLFCEYIPLALSDWLRRDPSGKAATVERQLSEIVRSLGDRRLLHMDGHFGNLRTDGQRIHLTDFGLATSPLFDLSPAEREFAARHATHDARYAAMRLVNWLVTDVCGIPVPPGEAPDARNEYVRRCAAGHLPDDVSPVVAAILSRHAPAAAQMNAFYRKLFGGDIHAKYPAP